MIFLKFKMITLLMFICLSQNSNAIYPNNGNIIIPWGNEYENELTVGLETKYQIRKNDPIKEHLHSIDLTRRGIYTTTVVSYEHKPETYLTIIFIHTPDEWEATRMINKLRKQTNLKWVKIIMGHKEFDPREFLSDLPFNDPLFSKQKRHPIMQTTKAWKSTQGEGVIVAVTDDGADINHFDLKNNIWVNADEIPDNGIDDDNNGFIDDIHGWDFVNDDNNPDERSLGHGTHVAGIVAAEANNGVGIVGTAPRAKIMPIKFFGYGKRPYSSLIVLLAYVYAVDNGANIITTSYNIDGFPNDPVYLAAIDYAYKNGVLVFNSAGNNGYQNPRRVDYNSIFLVGNTSTDSRRVDRRDSYSNYGIGIDLMAPGTEIISTVPRDRFNTMTGTSMSSPSAAGVAALIWSKNPSWNRAQVAAQLIGTCDNIDSANNSRYQHLLGAGRLNAFRAVSEKITPPTIKRLIGRDNVRMSFQLEKIFDELAFNNNKAFSLTNITTGEKIILTRDTHYQIASNKLNFTFNKALPKGKYKFIAHANILKDPFGVALDGNSDGIQGDDYILKFEK